MFKSIDPSNPPYIEPPFICDYVSVTAAHLVRKSAWFGQVLRNELCIALNRSKPFLPTFLQSNLIRCCQGYNICMGKGVYFNFNCTLLDGNLITIGDDTIVGPNVQIYPPGVNGVKTYKSVRSCHDQDQHSF